MSISNLLTDEAVLAEVGHRIARKRIDQQITQAEMADQAGVSKRTVERIETGASVQFTTIVRILRVLDLLPGLDLLFPESPASPMDLLKRKGKVRQRASGTGKVKVTPTDKKWSWDDEA
jgi:transcriptional regulator with XRE-family HTH domain